ncbi:hypothetical protein WJX79_000767 [Trebouxia sp. C0005]
MAVKPSQIGKAGKRVLNDKFFKKAKAEGYLARSAFKLQELQQKHKLIAPGSRVLDLGCSPGAWLQVACKCLGPKSRGGLVLGIDIQDVVLPKEHCDDRVEILQADARKLDVRELFSKSEGFHVVLSDMCHSTMGSSSADMDGSNGLLLPKGNLVMKLLQGAGSQEFAHQLRQHFNKVAWARPAATRSESREIYLLGLGRK